MSIEIQIILAISSVAALGISIAAFLTVRRAMGAINLMLEPIGEAVRFERARRDAVKRAEEESLPHVTMPRVDTVTAMPGRGDALARLRAANAAKDDK